MRVCEKKITLETVANKNQEGVIYYKPSKSSQVNKRERNEHRFFKIIRRKPTKCQELIHAF
jgi:hypothetical protein